MGKLFKDLKQGLEEVISHEKGKIHLEERWLFDPQNKELIEELKKALKQKADVSINLDDLEK